MANPLPHIWAVIRAVLAVVGAAALVAVGCIVVFRLRKDSSGDSSGASGPGQIIDGNKSAIEGLNDALDTLRNAWSHSNP